MQTIVAMLAAAQLPPPPEPEAVADGNAGLPLLLVSVGLAMVVILALIAVLLRRRTAAGGRRSASPPTQTFRIDHWRDGEATTLGYSDDPVAKDELLASYAARLRAQEETGSVVLVEQASDELVAIKPLAEEKRLDQEADEDYGAGAARKHPTT